MTKPISKTQPTIVSNLVKQRLMPLSFSVSFAAIGTLLELVPLILIYAIAIELLAPPIDPNYVWKLAAISVVAIFVKSLCATAAKAIAHKAAYEIVYDVRIALANKLNTLPLGYFNQKSSGNLKKVMEEDAENIEEALAHVIPDLVSAIALVLFTAIYLFTVDWRMTLATIATLPIAIAGQIYTSQAIKPLYQPYHDALEQMNSTIVEYVRGMKVVKAFQQTATSYAKYQTAVNRYHAIYEDWVWKSLPGLATFFICITANIVTVVPVGVWLYLQGSLELSTLILFLVLGLSFNAPLSKVMTIASEFYYISEGVKRINEIFQAKSLSRSQGNSYPTNCTIEFRDVTFSYNETRVLNGVSFTVPQGAIAAFVGASGAGKTTVARLIPRFWDVDGGEIRIGGVDIREMSVETLMSQVAFVFQDVFLFNDTILENIRFGNPTASEAEVIQAAKLARIHEFVETLPQGYQTIVGDRGAKLSGGQQQRISIARAILKQAPIIILDEATAFIDPENEAQIQDAISTLIEDKTLIVIAHRLSTITAADRIFVMDKGTIVAEGKHEELLKTSDLYDRMWHFHMQACKSQKSKVKGQKLTVRSHN
ncbi:ABC transporter ATP-binding protein [Chroococcidiopsis thermalis]|uniref:ABC transporter related protein n=1 Tax=Chroococcidiopsis thermalis (strain PCC 7203) TaxID=251229 RepID=K9U1W1_CHRTP|nr:ABC transporter ATP-binding protein [Chroococcidiopsis thermalis]AFY89092.1 ABC transporter related protein [Chroococcidiopsis thermalis PCC 7203]